MNNNNLNEFDRFDGGYNANGHFDWRTLWQGFDWENTRAEVDRDSRGRILIAGLTDAGKSTLLNRLCGWMVSQPSPEKPLMQEKLFETGREWLEDFGLFCLVDLPEGAPMIDAGYEFPVSELLPLDLADEADLILYVIDGLVGAQPIDYRWISRIRRLNKPMLIILNKSDMWEGETWRSLAQVEQRLSAAIVPVSATRGSNIIDTLVPKMVNLCPRLAIPLGRELRKFRRQMAERQIRQTALFNSVISLEPVPLLDIPVQLLTLVGMVARIAAVYTKNG